MPSQAQDVSTKLREVFNDSGFPAILDPLAPTPNTSVDPPDPAAGATAAVAAAEQSILKVRAVAESCARRMEGTGFVIGAGKVLTNAHVVAGSNRAAVEIGGGDAGRHRRAVRLAARPRGAGRARPDRAGAGLRGVAGGGRRRTPSSPATRWTVLTPSPRPGCGRSSTCAGRTSTPSATVTREVYTLRAQVRPGNSGGPLLAPDGTVLGVIFGAAIDEADVGFALTAAGRAGGGGRTGRRVRGLHRGLHRRLTPAWAAGLLLRAWRRARRSSW